MDSLLKLNALMGVLLQKLMEANVLSAGQVVQIAQTAGQGHMALRWLTCTLPDARRLVAADLNQTDPIAWLHEVRGVLDSLAGALRMVAKTKLHEGLRGKQGEDLSWLISLLEAQSRETVVLEQIAKIT